MNQRTKAPPDSMSRFRSARRGLRIAAQLALVAAVAWMIVGCGAVASLYTWFLRAIGVPTTEVSRLAVAGSPGQAADYYLWRVASWYGSDEVAMSPDACQDGMSFLQSDTAFIALRAPVYTTTLAWAEPCTQPVVFRGPYTSTLTLLDERASPATRLFTVPLELRAGRHPFLESALPPAEGERWVALGVAITPTVDCSGVPVMGQDWELEVNLYLDFGGSLDAGHGQTLPIYYCYEGQNAPFFLGSPGAHADATSYQGWGITCLGPHYLTLRDGPDDWELAGMGGAWITPTQVISFPHTLYNWTLTPPRPLTFTLEASSTLAAGWSFYADPQGQTPLAGPIRVDDVLEFWVFGQAPAGAAPGAYELFVIARTADITPASQQATDLLWVGDWVAPPLPPWWHKLYLPLVLKNA